VPEPTTIHPSPLATVATISAQEAGSLIGARIIVSPQIARQHVAKDRGSVALLPDIAETPAVAVVRLHYKWAHNADRYDKSRCVRLS
jgi:hypothetical protein